MWKFPKKKRTRDLRQFEKPNIPFNKLPLVGPCEAANDHSRRAGFMLLEVLLSVFIVTVGLVFVIGSFVTSIKAFKTSRSYVEVIYLLEEKMWEYEESGSIEEGSDSGTFEEYKGASWEIEAEELEDLPLNEVTMEVVLKKEGRERSFKISTYLFNEDELSL